jgi:hypothetical protein
MDARSHGCENSLLHGTTRGSARTTHTEANAAMCLVRQRRYRLRMVAGASGAASSDDARDLPSLFWQAEPPPRSAATLRPVTFETARGPTPQAPSRSSGRRFSRELTRSRSSSGTFQAHSGFQEAPRPARWSPSTCHRRHSVLARKRRARARCTPPPYSNASRCSTSSTSVIYACSRSSSRAAVLINPISIVGKRAPSRSVVVEHLHGGIIRLVERPAWLAAEKPRRAARPSYRTTLLARVRYPSLLCVRAARFRALLGRTAAF